jgi:hypothetical protein
MDLLKYQVKSITPVDEYICELSDELKEIAKLELNETEEIRKSSIEVIRDWVLHNDRIIKTRLDSNFILRLLRYSKYDLDKTKECLERWMLLFEIGYEQGWLSDNFDIKTNVQMREFVENYGITLPSNNPKSPVVNLHKAYLYDPNVKNSLQELLSVVILSQEVLLSSEENQIRGVIKIQDFKGFTLRHTMIRSPFYLRKLVKYNENTFHGRLKEIHILNLPTALNFVLKICVSASSAKMKARYHFYSSNQELLNSEKFKNVRFPTEYGGDLDITKLSQEETKSMQSFRDLFIKYHELKLNRSLYPSQVLNGNVECLKIPLEKLCKNVKS